MSTTSQQGGFERIREAAVGPPMWNLFLECLRYWRRLGLGVFSAAIYRLSRLVPPIIVSVAIDRIISAPGDPGIFAELGLLPSGVVPESATAARIGLLETLVIIAVVAYLIRAVARFFARYLIQSMAQKIQRDLRNRTYDHMQTLSMDFFNDNETGGIMSILNNDINRLEQFLNTELTQIIRVATVVVGIGSVMFYVSPKLALIALLPVPFIGFASGSFLVWIDRKYRKIRETVSRLSSRLANNLGGMKVIKTFNRYDYESDLVSEHSQQYHDKQIGALKIRRAYFALLRLTTGVSFVLILYYGGYDVIEGTLTVGTFTLFFLFLRRLYGPMRRIGRTANKYQLAKSSAERVFGLLGIEASISAPEDPVVPETSDGRVAFEQVSFAYNDQDTVLKDINLRVDPGETIGLVGETGAGKSTLVKLIPRFHDPLGGRVLVNDVDVRHQRLADLRQQIGLVDQDPYLFSGTVLENIAYGDEELLNAVMDHSEDDSIDSDVLGEVRTAAQAAEADAFIRNLQEGYSTQIGERGVKLSGGQRQRISIARALLNDPGIIIFDEATSDVDTHTEELIQASLERLIEDRTAFLIAHRLSTVQQADRIVVLDDGEIVEMGDHSELMGRQGKYADLWDAQTDGSGSLDRVVG
ncbi:MAG: ABC transporter ATP-binding protein [bacterium]